MNPATMAAITSTAPPNTASTAGRCFQPCRSSQPTSGTSKVAKNRATINGTTITLSRMSRYSTSPTAVSTTSSRQLQAANRRNTGGTSGRVWLEAFGGTAAGRAIGSVPPPVVTAPAPSPRGSRVAMLLRLLCLGLPPGPARVGTGHAGCSAVAAVVASVAVAPGWLVDDGAGLGVDRTRLRAVPALAEDPAQHRPDEHGEQRAQADDGADLGPFVTRGRDADAAQVPERGGAGVGVDLVGL